MIDVDGMMVMKIKEWYDEGQDKEEYGLEGHEFVVGDDSMMSG